MLPILLTLLGCSDYSFEESKPVITEEDDTAVEEIVEPSENPDILIEPNPIDFQYVLKNCTSDPIDVTITNTGLADLEVSDIYLEGDGDTSFASTYDNSPFTLTTGESRTIGLYFIPDLTRDYAVELKVESNDPEDPTAAVDVFGIGSSGGVFEESFTQEYNTNVDVLWVIDNSCSMQDNVTNVKNNFSAFMGSFLSLGLDYNMAIVTTDTADGGIFQGPVMNSSQGQASVEATFNQTLNSILSGAGTSASQDTEKGLEVTKLALDNPNQSSFIRDPSYGLSVILVTDEDDNGSNITGNNFISWFQGKKANDITLSRMSAFLDANGGLLGGNATYDAVISATQGYIADINAQNWSSDLEAIALASAGLTIVFPLSQVPTSSGGITVYVDGTLINQGIESGWTYDPRANALIFHGSSIPEAGDVVNVSYSVPTSCN